MKKAIDGSDAIDAVDEIVFMLTFSNSNIFHSYHGFVPTFSFCFSWFRMKKILFPGDP